MPTCTSSHRPRRRHRWRGDQGLRGDRRPTRPSRSRRSSRASPTTQVPEIAEFSSRGPSVTTGGDVAQARHRCSRRRHPRRHVAGRLTPAGNWDLLSGTSMASPHVAGISMLIQQQHPRLDASDDQVGTADHVRPTHVTTTSPFEQGSGLRAAGAGWLTPAWSTTPGGTTGCPSSTGRAWSSTGSTRSTPPTSTRPRSAIGQLAGAQTVTRTVTNVGARRHVRRLGPRPARSRRRGPALGRCRWPRGESASFDRDVHATDSATLDEWSTGSSPGPRVTPDVRSAVAVKPVGVSAPGEVSGTGPTAASTCP